MRRVCCVIKHGCHCLRGIRTAPRGCEACVLCNKAWSTARLCCPRLDVLCAREGGVSRRFPQIKGRGICDSPRGSTARIQMIIGRAVGAWSTAKVIRVRFRDRTDSGHSALPGTRHEAMRPFPAPLPPPDTLPAKTPPVFSDASTSATHTGKTACFFYCKDIRKHPPPCSTQVIQHKRENGIFFAAKTSEKHPTLLHAGPTPGRSQNTSALRFITSSQMSLTMT